MKNALALKENSKVIARRGVIELKTPSEISRMRDAGKILAEVFEVLRSRVSGGITTKALDHIAFTEIKKRGAAPAFLNYNGYPAVICASINEEVVHGLPAASRVVKDGNIVSIDIGVVYKGYYADAAVTFAVGNIESEARKLVEVTKSALDEAISVLGPDVYLGNVSNAIETIALNNGMNVVRDFVGHGIGRNLHEEPAVLNYGKKGTGIKLKPGLVLAIEPMINLGTGDVEIKPDGWTVVTSDRKLSAHFEHTVAVTETGSEILTSI